MFESKSDFCLTCFFRSMAAPPTIWTGDKPPNQVVGLVISSGMVTDPATLSGYLPYLDLWTRDGRVRVLGNSYRLAALIQKTEPKIGDQVEVTFTGYETFQSGTVAGIPYKNFRVIVTRGDHLH